MASAFGRTLWARTMSSGVSLVAITVLATNFVRIFSTLILTRALSPDDFGAVGLIGAVQFILVMLSDVGFALYIVRHPNGDDPRLLDVIWTVRFLRGVAMMALMIVFSGPIVSLLGKEGLQLALAVTAINFLLEGCTSLAPYAAVREERLARLSLMDILSTVSQTLAGIGLALLLHNYWAIIYAGLIGLVVKVALSYSLFPNSSRKWSWDKEIVKDLWSFGKTIAGANTIHVFIMNVDKLVLSRLFPLYNFGLYSLAMNLSGVASGFTTMYPSRVLLPAYGRTNRETPDQLADVYYGQRRLIMILYMVVMGGFIAMAPSVINLLYDPRYEAAADYLRILAVAPAMSMNVFAAREMLIVVGKVRFVLLANIIRAGWLGIFGTLGYLLYGPMGLVFAVGALEVPVQLYCWFELQKSGLLRPMQEVLYFVALAFGALLGVIGNQIYFSLLAGYFK